MKAILVIIMLLATIPLYEGKVEHSQSVKRVFVPVVINIPKPPPDPTICLAKNIYFEAGAESYDGKLGVGQVTLNRSKSKQFPHSLCGVVYQSINKFNKKICQFSWVCERHSKIAMNSKAWKDSLSVSHKMIAGKLAEQQLKEAKALYFHNGTVYPSWASSKTYVASIDNHTFYAD